MDGRTVAPAECADSVCDREVVGAWIIIDIQLYVSPPVGMVNVDVRENIPMVCFVGLSAGGKSLISWREPHGQP